MLLSGLADRYDLQYGLGLELWTYAVWCVCIHGAWFHHRDVCDAGERWKKHREMFERQFQPAVAPMYWPVQRKEAHRLIRNILDTPGDLIEHLRQLALIPFESYYWHLNSVYSNAASVIMNVIYGIEIVPRGDEYIDIAEEALEGLAKAAAHEAFLVDTFPLRA